MRVDNRDERPVKADADRGRNIEAEPQFFANSLKNQHVRIDRHTDAENQSGDTRQSQRRFDHDQRRNREDHVQYQGHDGVNTCSAIIKQHENDDEYEAAKRRLDARFDRIGTEARADRSLLLILDLCR